MIHKEISLAIKRHLHEILIAIAARRVTRGGLALAIVFLAGSTGYVLIEGWSYFDAVYMTVVTMTTVGYEEVRPLSPLGRFFNLFVMLAGVGLMLYILTVTVQSVVEDEIFRVFMRRRRMRAKIEAIADHYILCGYGRVGREAAAAFRGEGVDVVAVDIAEARTQAAEEAGLLAVCRDATQNESLLQAGIERARGLIAATGSDSSNVLITLTAKANNPSVTIVARADAVETREKLKLAGADHVVTPYSIGGRRLALSAVRPLTADFLDDILDPSRIGPRLAEFAVVAESRYAGMDLNAFTATHGLQVLAVRKQDGQVLFSPATNVVLEPGDKIVVAGDDTQLQSLKGDA